MEGEHVPGRGRPKGRGRAPVDPAEIKVEAVPPAEDQPEPQVLALEAEERAVSVSTGLEELAVGSPKPEITTAGSRGRREPEAYLSTRPQDPNFNKTGTSGQPITLVANYFRMQKKKTFQVHQYRVDFEPDYDEAIIRKGIFRQFKEKLPMYIFDGTVLYCQEILPPEQSKFETQDKRIPDKTVAVTIRYIKLLESEDAGMVQFHNIVLRSMMNGLNLTLLGRHYYDAAQRIDKPNWRLELWPGFMTSLRTCDGGDSLLNVEVTHKVIRTDTVLNLLTQIKNEAQNASEEDRQRRMSDAVVGRIVMTRYNQKTYKIKSIEWGSTAKSTFLMKKEKRDVSFIEYYQNVYKLEIKYSGQPLLQAEPRKQDIHRDGASPTPILLVPELCFITGLDEDQRSNFNLTRDLSEHLHMPPGKRVDAIRSLIRRIMTTEKVKTDLENWGVRFTPDPISVTGRVLPSEKLLFSKNGKIADAAANGDWSKTMRDFSMYSCVELTKWVLVVPSRFAEGVDNLVRTLSRVSNPLNFRLAQPDIVRLPNPSAEGYMKTFNDIMTEKGGDVQLFFVILPNNRLELYSAIKQRISIDFGIISQCFLAKNVNNKGLMSIATKVAIQMNAKLGGEPWALNNPLKNLMVIGFDVYHSAGSGNSIGCMSATIKNTLARYFTTVAKFDGRQEISDKIAVPLAKCLTAYKFSNGVLPDRIMFYRDGVGEGQLKYVYEVELEQIKKHLEITYGKDKMPKLTFVIVSKRLNTRFMSGGQGANNPPPGTIVDTVVTFPERYDFYLVPQSARQGTVSPISYNVLYDSSGLPADKVQIFSFKLCHGYFNWSGTVSVPAPCQYAHKLAYLTGLSLKRPASKKLDFLLHYL